MLFTPPDSSKQPTDFSLPPQLQKAAIEAVVVFCGADNRYKAGQTLAKAKAVPAFYSGLEAQADIRRLFRENADDILSDSNTYLDLEARNTHDNAVNTAAWLKERNFSKIALVTSKFHMRRSLLELRSESPLTEIFPISVANEMTSEINMKVRALEPVKYLLTKYTKLGKLHLPKNF